MHSFILRQLEGWRLVGTLAVLLLLGMGAVLLLGHGDVESLRRVIRFTARTSIVLFLLAFTASSAIVLFASGFTRWQRRNRRYLGVSFAVSHFIHAGAIYALFRTDPALFWTLSNVGTIAAGGLAYVFIAAMALTSFDAAVRFLGQKTWKVLHVTGTWYIWLSFIVTFGKRVPTNGWYAAALVLLFIALLLRLLAWISRRRAQSTPLTI